MAGYQQQRKHDQVNYLKGIIIDTSSFVKTLIFYVDGASIYILAAYLVGWMLLAYKQTMLKTNQ